MHMVIRKFPHLHSVRDAAQRAETGLVAILRKAPGFEGYCIFDAGGGVGGSVTFFKDRESAVAANARALVWIAESLPDLYDGEPEILVGEILYSGGVIPAPASQQS
ncbi:MAG: hypothetical protein JWO64_3606 [Hyphomicrobiales bacterium]|jgi:hypothetical protein|nr:hypothetical protein [Hyphomicrobiales bacterium]